MAVFVKVKHEYKIYNINYLFFYKKKLNTKKYIYRIYNTLISNLKCVSAPPTGEKEELQGPFIFQTQKHTKNNTLYLSLYTSEYVSLSQNK